MSSAARLLRRFGYQRLDYVAATLLMMDLVVEAAVESGIPHRLATALLAVPFAGTIAVRRRWPAAAVVACSVVVLAQEPFHGQLFDLQSSAALLPFMLCAYGAGAWLPWRRGLAALALAAGLLLADQLVEVYVTEGGSLASGIFFSVALLAVPWLVGRFITERRDRAEAFTALAAQTEVERAGRERAAIAQERVRISRELQDIIAHSVSVMVVQAGGARRILHTEPDRARESILTIEHTGREALAEMRRLLGLLRKDDDPRALAPQPGLDQLGELAGALSREGLTCEVDTDGTPIDLTPGIDLVSYRVLEAALENAAQRGCARACASVHYTPGRLELAVLGDRPLPDLAAALEPIRERVDLYGGRLTVNGDTPFTVHCELPLEAASVG
jgi:signal transduction histidine kinase